MSSILEALERAEEERLRGEGAVLRPLPASRRKRSWGGLIWVLILIMVLALLLNLAFWFYQQQTATVAPAVPPHPVPPHPVQREMPAPVAPTAVESRRERAAAASQPALSVRDQLKRHTPPSSKPLLSEALVARPPPPVASPAPKAIEPEAVPLEPDAKPEVSPPLAATPAAAEPVMPAREQPAQRTVKPAPEPAAVATTVEPAPPTAASTAQPAAQAPIPLVWELPQYLREKILQLKSSVHVYNENPAQRFVIINMHRYGEGDTLPPDDFRLKRIERDGMIIDYGEGLVRLEQR
ncbi:MAG: general secretion pathway protein GspB [Candidatus Thiodiazotropha sp.]